MTTPSKLLVAGAVPVTSVGGGLGIANFGLDDSKVNAYAMSLLVAEIAAALHLSVATVKAHVSHLLHERYWQ